MPEHFETLEETATWIAVMIRAWQEVFKMIEDRQKNN